jgi:hypothetical protein
VPVPYYAYYSSPPVGAVVLMVAGVAYLMSQDGSYSKKTTSNEGKVVYQSVPAPQGASVKTLPAQRVLVTVSGTTYYVNANAFYRGVMNGAQETFVVVTPPAGVVFVAALPPDFEVVQLNTMYFTAKGQYYVPFLAADGKELYVMVDRPPAPPAAGTTTPAAAPAAAPAAKAGAAPAGVPVQAVAERFVVPEGTLVVVRLAADVSSETAHVGDRVQGFLDQDLAANGRLVAPRGAKVYGVVSAVDDGSKDERPGHHQRDADRHEGRRQGPDGQDQGGECGRWQGDGNEEGGGWCGNRRRHRCHRGWWRRRGHCGELRQAGGHRCAVAAGVRLGSPLDNRDHDQRGSELTAVCR